MIAVFCVLILLLLYYVLGGLLTVVNIFRTMSGIRKAKALSDPCDVDCLIMIPAYKEDRIIGKTIQYFYDLIENSKTMLLIVCSAREDNSQVAAVNKTWVAAQQAIQQLNQEHRVIAIKAPSSAAGKVGQMNFGLEWICSNLRVPEYIGIFDADSRPDPNVLRVLHSFLQNRTEQCRKAPEIIQQVSSYFGKAECLKGGSGVLAICDALFQTKWAIGFEYPLFRCYSRSVQKSKLRPLAYCIGHGCFVRSDYLQMIGGFPTYNKNDDLSLGYLTSVFGAEICPLPSLDVCEISPIQKMTVKQYRNWYSGSARYWKDICHYEQEFSANLSVMQKCVFFIQGGIRNVLWAWRGTLWLLLLVVGLLSGRTFFQLAGLLALVLYVWLPLTITAHTLYREEAISVKKSFLCAAIVFSPISFLIRSIGPCLASLSIGARKSEQYKAERICTKNEH